MARSVGIRSIRCCACEEVQGWSNNWVLSRAKTQTTSVGFLAAPYIVDQPAVCFHECCIRTEDPTAKAEAQLIRDLTGRGSKSRRLQVVNDPGRTSRELVRLVIGC